MPNLLLAFAAAAFAAGAQAFSGFGFGLLIVPLLVLLAGPRDAVVASNVLGTCLVAAMVANERAEVEWARALRLVAFAVVGMPLGMAAFLWLPAQWLQVCIAVAVLAGTAAVARGFRIGSAGLAADAAAGLLSGILRMATSMSGPPVVLYLQSTGMNPRTFRATISAFFLGSGLIAVPILLAAGKAGSGAATAIAGGLPGLLLGWWAGTRLFGLVSERVFRTALFAILAASSLAALALAFR